MAERQQLQTLEQFRAKMDCRTGVQIRVSTFQQSQTNPNEEQGQSHMRECRAGVKGRISSWAERENDYSKKAKDNVFGEHYVPGLRVSESEYGTPEAGSRTDQRGRLAGQRVSNEVWELCEIIAELGQRTGSNTWCITFGHLFETYTRISNKVVGMLLRARRQNLVDFEGEMLFQGRDDNVVITLLKDPAEIEGVESLRQNVGRRH